MHHRTDMGYYPLLFFPYFSLNNDTYAFRPLPDELAHLHQGTNIHFPSIPPVLGK